jgi:hypothetical protein
MMPRARAAIASGDSPARGTIGGAHSSVISSRGWLAARR